MAAQDRNHRTRFGLVRSALTAGLFAVIAAGPGVAQETPDDEALAVVARVGPWPVASGLIGFAGRLWFVNSVKYGNHNSADIYSLDPVGGAPRYERRLFSQDGGRPAVFGGRLYWPFEDSRFSLGMGHYLVTDGRDWGLGTIPTADIFHVHAMAGDGERLYAATSAWRGGIDVSDDRGVTWRRVYEHPTRSGRVSRFVDLRVVDGQVFAALIDRSGDGLEHRLMRLDGETMVDVPGWPHGKRVVSLAGYRGWLYGIVEGALWRTDGRSSMQLAAPSVDALALAAAPDGLWAASGKDGEGVLWHSPDGRDWRRVGRFEGGRPVDMAVIAGVVFVAGAGDDGRGIIWRHIGRSVDFVGVMVGAGLPPRKPVVQPSADAAVDRALVDPASYDHHAGRLSEAVHAAALGAPPAGFFAERLAWPLPEHELGLIGGKVTVPAARFGRWILLWGMALAGEGRVPPALIAEPWTAPANQSEKFFELAPAAMWAAAAVGQRDRATIAALIERLDRADDPPWLVGDVVGALTALTGERFGYDADAWRGWWATAAADWDE